MKKVLAVIGTLVILLTTYSCWKKVSASGEVSGELSGEKITDAVLATTENKKENTFRSYQIIGIPFAVKQNVSFPDLKVVKINPKTGQPERDRKTGEIIIEDHNAKREIIMAARVGFLEGYPSGDFRPDNSITRGEFIKALMALATNRTFDFVAIPTNYAHWAGKFVSLAEMQGIIAKGEYTEEELDEPITRLEVVCMLARVQIKMKGIPQNQLGHLVFTDIDELTQEEKALLLHATSYDLLDGMRDESMKEFEPTKNITRGEVAKALIRIY